MSEKSEKTKSDQPELDYKSMYEEAQVQIVELEKKIVSTNAKSLAIYEKNQQLMASEDIARKEAQLKYDLAVSKQFADSGAFPFKTPEECYVIMQAGKEMGLPPIVSMKLL